VESHSLVLCYYPHRVGNRTLCAVGHLDIQVPTKIGVAKRENDFKVNLGVFCPTLWSGGNGRFVHALLFDQ